MEVFADSEGSVDIQSLKVGAVGGKENGDEVSYMGPTLDELDEELQQNLADFVEGVAGIDADVIAWMMMEGDRVEQTKYVQWLEGLKKVVA